MSLGDAVDIYLLGSVTGQYRSNLFNTENNEVDDFVFIFAPGVEINIGRSSQARFNLQYTHDLVKYVEADNLDTAAANLRGTGTYAPGGPAVFSGSVNLVQSQQNQPDTAIAGGLNGSIVERTRAGVSAKVDYSISERTSADVGFGWDSTFYTNNEDFGNRFSDRHSFSAPVNVLYQVTPKYKAGLGYRFRYTTVDDNSAGARGDEINNFISLAIRGEIMPKLSVNANSGVQIRTMVDDNTVGGKDSVGFGSNVNLIYAATPKFTVIGGFDADFEPTATGDASTVYTPSARAIYEITPLVSASSEIFFRIRENSTTDRGDDTLGFSIGASYRFQEYFTFGANYTLINNWTQGTGGRDYLNNIISLSASVRY